MRENREPLNLSVTASPVELNGRALTIPSVQDMAEVQESAPLRVSVTEQLIGEIRAWRDLLAVERAGLTVQIEDCSAKKLLTETWNAYVKHPVAEGRILDLDPAVVDKPIRTCDALFPRVLGNMVKIALEATVAGGTVRMVWVLEKNLLLEDAGSAVPLSRGF